ncbi:site-specific integrase [Amycolatopsis anabasis]|uniref:site-specific integrase n=1 Tax=Amycolatopsis anabasis TaxID=1840409 RepID=UPI00131ADF10|nr:site-specific integrase [Amycolatopsis anabasis]
MSNRQHSKPDLVPGVSALAGLDICAAAGLTVEPHRRKGRPRFDHDLWDFTCVAGMPRHQESGGQKLDFSTIPNPSWRLLAKEYIFALLAPRHEQVRVLPRAYRTPRTVSTCHQRLFHVRRWFTWLADRGVSDLAEVGQDHCDAFLQWCHHSHDRHGRITRPTTPDYRHQAVLAVKELAAYADLFTTGGYRPGFEPWPGRAAQQVAGAKSRAENSTPPVRPEVLQPLLAAAFYVIERLAPQVLVLRTSERRREAAWERRFDRYPGLEGRWPVISKLVQRYVARGEPLPATSDEQVGSRLAHGWDPHDPLLRVSVKQLALEAGIRNPMGLKPPDDIRAELAAAAVRVGVEHPVARNAALVPRADGAGQVPWTLPIPAHTKVVWLIERVRTACLVVVAAVTGMRMSEITELPVDCRLPPVQVAEGLVHYRVKSKRIKGEPHGGTWDEWVVVAEVHHALGLLRQLLDEPDAQTHLFGRGKLNFGQRIRGFRDWVNGTDGQRLGLAPIPDDAITVRMMRRSLALELAHRPGGLLAAKVHLKHVSVATTEGYAARPGGSQAFFLAEIAKEEQARNLDLTIQAFEDYRAGILPAGPGARDLTEFFDSVDEQLRTQPQASPNVKRGDREIVTLLAKRAKTLHLGVANVCWFADPAKALCLKLAGTPTADRPLAGMCDSARCPQATHHACHRPVWEESARSTKVFLGNLARRQTTERARLHAQLARAERVVAEIDAASGTEEAAS